VGTGNSLPFLCAVGQEAAEASSVMSSEASVPVMKRFLQTAVRAQLEVMRAPEWQNKATVVIGPVFPADFSRDFIANELKYGIARLAKQGQLNEKSQFVAEAQSILGTISRARGARIPLDELLSAAQTSNEAEVANAISLSLR